MEGQIKKGDKVLILSGDGDGAEGKEAIVKMVYRSGRCLVEYGNNWRNLPQKLLRKIS